MNNATILLFILLIIMAGLAVAVVFFYVYWRRVQRPTPTLDGELRLCCLDGPVEMMRDRYGIPHIYAESDADLFRALGLRTHRTGCGRWSKTGALLRAS